MTAPAAAPGSADDRFDWAARATLLVWLLDPPLGWPAAVPALGLAGVGLLWPGLARRGVFWLALAAVACFRVGLDWMLADNHHYLMAVWCFALALSRLDDEPGAAAAVNARRLVGLAFAFAVVWKAVLSPDFLDGRFFRVTLLVDSRFETAAVAWGGLDAATVAANDDTLAAFDPEAAFDEADGSGGDAGPAGDGPRLQEPPRLRAIAYGATAWTLVIEALVALCFLWPARLRARPDPGRLRDASLLAFCWTTYAIAPVVGFGWLLAALGLAQCERPRVRVLYAATLLVILIHHRVPWLEVLVGSRSGV
ncbi:MAG: hypothetical protein ACQGVK_06025 [Myxococcota bacterium]